MPPKTICVLDNRESTIWDRLLGAVGVGSFVTLWLSSIASPVIFCRAVRRENYIIASSLLATTVLAYLPWERGILSQWLRRFLHRYHPRYYRSCKIVFEEALPDSKTPTFYAVHPHGAFGMGWACLYCLPQLESVRFNFSSALFATPLFRLFTRMVGKPGAASKGAMVRCMEQKQDMALLPGGFEEATISSLRHDRAFIQKRTGFVRLCLKYGYQIRPVYAFGEKKLFWNIQGAFPFRLAMNRYKIPGVLVWGNSFLPILPKASSDLLIVVGTPIRIPHIVNPTAEDVKFWHSKYVIALQKLFDEHKESAYGAEEANVTKLEIW